MEIKTIISSICLLLLAVSCSMDDDALRDIEKGHSGSAVIEEGEVALSMKSFSSFFGDKILVWCRDIACFHGRGKD